MSEIIKIKQEFSGLIEAAKGNDNDIVIGLLNNAKANSAKGN